MPKKMGYSTGGKHPMSGDAGHNSSGSGGGSVSVDQGGAGMGTGYHNPNIKDDAKPGGYGSSGKKSDSSPSKG